MRKFLYICLFFVLFISIKAQASVSSGTIDNTYKQALVCHEVTCSTVTPGIINFKPTGTTPVTIDDVNGIDGIAWGNELGWINFDTTGESLIINTTTGVISGKAWSQVSGWINFSVTGQQVKINNNGEFEGFAWTGGPNGGWIKFDCNTVGACVKTDWRPLSQRDNSEATTTATTTTTTNTGGALSAGSSQPIDMITNVDMCSNLQGNQTIIPFGYKVDEGGLCLLDIDYCSNISGKQLSVPVGYGIDREGLCIKITENNQDKFFIPKKDKIINKGDIDNSGQDTTSNNDLCINLYGMQNQLPIDYVVDQNGFCIPSNTDYCPNISGMQTDVPNNMFIGDDGECYYIKDQNNKDIINIINENVANKIKILGFSFISNNLQILIDLPFLNNLFNKQIKLDLMSVLIIIVLIIFIYMLVKSYKRIKNK